MAENTDDEPDFVDEVTRDEIALRPGDSADPESLVLATIPADLRNKYEIHSYRSAAVILSQSHKEEFEELCEALRMFQITTTMIRRAGGNESDIPKLLSNQLRPLGWRETIIQGDLLVRQTWREFAGTTKGGKAKYKKDHKDIRRDRFLDGHKVDYVKGRVAFDLEWNSKDQTFDRDLYTALKSDVLRCIGEDPDPSNHGASAARMVRARQS
jgi:hypothetical protein